jgi:transcriptional regulator with XRE-family HTH domain
MEIGSRLREIRQERALTLEQVQADARVSQPYLSKVETGRSLPNPDTFRRIADSIGVESHELETLVEHLLFQRDRTELEKMGFSPEIAELAAALQRLGPDAHGAVRDAVCRAAPDLSEFLDSGTEAGNGGTPPRHVAAP